MGTNFDKFSDLTRGLDDLHRTVLVAKCIKLLMDEGKYDSPMFKSRPEPKIAKLLGQLAIANVTKCSPLQLCGEAVHLEDDLKTQKLIVADAEDSAKEWTTGKLAYHDDAWIPKRTVERAREGETIIQWLISMRKSTCGTSEVASEIDRVLDDKMTKWGRKFGLFRYMMPD